MTLDYKSLLFGPAYAVFGVRAVVIFADTSSKKSLVVIDKTAGLDLGIVTEGSKLKRTGGANIDTIMPVAIVRHSELDSKAIVEDRLPGSRLVFNRSEWNIESIRQKPTVNGENDGELYLILEFVRRLSGELPDSESETEFDSEASSFSEDIPEDGLVAFEFTQNTPSDTWTINHNLGYKPIVYLYTPGGVAMEGQVTSSGLNQTIVTFTSPQAGSARLV